MCQQVLVMDSDCCCFNIMPLINIPIQAATFRIERHFKIKYCRHYDYNYSYLLDSIMNQIPADELDSVYLGAEINDVGALLRFGKSPIGKYVCEQIDMAKVHPTVKDDIIRQFTSAQPKWVLTQSAQIRQPSCSNAIHQQIRTD